MKLAMTKSGVRVLPFTRKLTPEEFAEILENWEYDPNRFDDDDLDTPAPIYDAYGNPTVETIDAMYESLHGLCEAVTLEELSGWVDGLKDEEHSRVAAVQAG